MINNSIQITNGYSLDLRIFGFQKKSFSLQSSPPGDLRLRSGGEARKTYWQKTVQQHGIALEDAPEQFKKDKEIVMAAVARHGWAFEFASEEFKRDKDFVLEMVKTDGTALNYAADAVRGDREFLLEAVRATTAHWLQKLCTKELQEDEVLKEEATKVAGEGLIFTYYDNYSCFDNMRDAFLATGASVPGGPAYDAVMESLNSKPGGAAATLMSFCLFKCFGLGWWIG